jgi:hypothetical protein
MQEMASEDSQRRQGSTHTGSRRGRETKQSAVRGARGHELRDESAKREPADQWRVEATSEVGEVGDLFAKAHSGDKLGLIWHALVVVPQGWCVNGPAALFKVVAHLGQLLSDL